jgi:hypothetical protein
METPMPKLRVHNFSISLDGYAAGPDQSLSTSSTTASTPRSSERSTPPAARACGSAVARPPSSSTSAPV